MLSNSARNFKLMAIASLCLSASLALLPLAGDAFSITVPAPQPTIEPALDRVQLENLKTYDVIVFIDASHSMAIADCAGQSRWQWCQTQTKVLRDVLHVPLGNHLRMVAFSDNFKVYPDVAWGSVAGFFASNKPSGNTDMTKAIKSQLAQYFAARKALAPGDRQRPLLIAMITDGLPDRPMALKETIIDATKQMNDADQLAITFLQVGSDAKATKYLQELDECLVSHRAAHDIVKSKTFAEVNQVGLVSALLQSLSPPKVASNYN